MANLWPLEPMVETQVPDSPSMPVPWLGLGLGALG